MNRAEPQILVALVQMVLRTGAAVGLDRRALLEEAGIAESELAVSTRTLTRRLQEEGVSFRQLLAEVREKLACAWLRESELSLHEVAYLLGYSEPSTFFRSFRKWTGHTPAAWRRGP